METIKNTSIVIGGGDFNEWKNYVKKKIPPDYSVETPVFRWGKKGDFTTLSTWSVVLESKAVIDHIITCDVHRTILEDYNWDFVNPKNGYAGRQDKDYKSDLLCLPDHAILCGEIYFDF